MQAVVSLSAGWGRVCAPALSSPWPSRSPADPADGEQQGMGEKTQKDSLWPSYLVTLGNTDVLLAKKEAAEQASSSGNACFVFVSYLRGQFFHIGVDLI